MKDDWKESPRWADAKWQAFCDGLHCGKVTGNGNPYRKGSVMAAEWNRGFAVGQKESEA